MLGHSLLNFSYPLKIYYICHIYTSHVLCNIYIFTLITLPNLLEFLIWLNIGNIHFMMYMKWQMKFSNYNIIHIIYFLYERVTDTGRNRKERGWEIAKDGKFKICGTENLWKAITQEDYLLPKKGLDFCSIQAFNGCRTTHLTEGISLTKTTDLYIKK